MSGRELRSSEEANGNKKTASANAISNGAMNGRPVPTETQLFFRRPARDPQLELKLDGQVLVTFPEILFTAS